MPLVVDDEEDEELSSWLVPLATCCNDDVDEDLDERDDEFNCVLR